MRYDGNIVDRWDWLPVSWQCFGLCQRGCFIFRLGAKLRLSCLTPVTHVSPASYGHTASSNELGLGTKANGICFFKMEERQPLLKLCPDYASLRTSVLSAFQQSARILYFCESSFNLLLLNLESMKLWSCYCSNQNLRTMKKIVFCFVFFRPWEKQRLIWVSVSVGSNTQIQTFR